MEITAPHAWPDNREDAIAIQESLRSRVIAEDRLGEVRYVAGVDVGYETATGMARAAVAVLSFPDLQVVETAIARRPETFPYIPGFLSFREVPAVLDVLGQLKQVPDLLLCDGQGIAHPRAFGLACHIGVLTDLPAIGVAKSRLVGKHEEVGSDRGSQVPLIYKGETVGVVLRSRTNVRPLYISIGHRISLPTAIDYTMRCLTKYRLPETTRRADRLSKGN